VDSKYGNNAQAIGQALINAFPPTNLANMTAGASFANPISAAPFVNGGLNSGSTSVAGTSREANGTTIEVFKGGASLGSTTVSGGIWSLSITAGQLADNDLITAKATASGKQTSISSNNVLVTYCTVITPVIAGRTCTTPECTGGTTGLNGTWAMTGVTPNGSNVEIKLYTQNASGSFDLVNPASSGAKYYVKAAGTWQFATNLPNSNFQSANFFATAVIVSTGCESGKSNVSQKIGGTLTAIPTITSTNISTSTTSIVVKNNDATSAKLFLYINGNQVSVTASPVSSNASHTFTVSGFQAGDELTARAQGIATDYWLSNASGSLTVAQGEVGATSAPVITGSYLASATAVNGSSGEPEGTTIQVFKAGSTLLGSTTVSGFGAWSVTGITLTAGDVLTAKASVTGKAVSAASNSKTVGSSLPSAPSISGSITTTTSSLSGTGGSGTVTLYVDGLPIQTVTPVGGNWSITGIEAGQFYKGASVTARNTVGDLESAASTAVTVTGPYSFTLALNGAAPTTAGQSFAVTTTAKSAVNGGGSTITDFTGKVSFSASGTLQTGGGISNNFSSGVLSSHSLSLRTSGVAYTLTAISTDDPGVFGTLSIPAVSPGAATQVLLTSPADVMAGTRAAYSVSLKDAYGNNTTQAGAQTLYLSVNGTTGLFKNAASGGTDITSVTIPAGQSTADFWFYAEKSGAYTITVSDAATPDFANGLADATDAITINAAAASKFVLDGFPQMYKNANMTITGQLTDAFGNAVATAGQTVAWSQTLGASTTSLSNTVTSADGSTSLSVNIPPSANTNDVFTFTATSGSNTGQITVTVVEGKVWRGQSDKNHKNAPNWTDNTAPGTSETKPLFFAADANNPLELTDDQVFSDIYLNGDNSSHKIILKGKKLSVTGKIIVKGSARVEAKDPNDILEFTGSANQSIPANVFLDNQVSNIVINQSTATNELAIEGTTKVTGTLTVTKGKLKTNGNLVLKSDATGTARVAPITTDAAIEGEVTVERYLSLNQVTGVRTGRAWRLISIPVTGSATLRDFLMAGRDGTDLTVEDNRLAEPSGSGTPIVGHAFADAGEAYAAGYDYLLSNQVSSVRRFVGTPSGGTFNSADVPDLSTKLSNAEQGYMVFSRGDRATNYLVSANATATTFSSVGTLKQGDQTVNIPSKSTSAVALVGNPYMAPLNLEALYADNSTVIEPYYYIWDANLSNAPFYQGGYRTYSNGGSGWASSVSGLTNPGLVESGLAFFVVPKSTTTAATLTIKEAHKAVNLSPSMPFEQVTDKESGAIQVTLELETSQGVRLPLNGVVASFNKNYQTAAGDLADIQQFSNISSAPIWFRRDNQRLISEGQPWPNDLVSRTLQLGISGLQSYGYILKFNPSRGMVRPGISVWLKDRHLNKEIRVDVENENLYRFNPAGSIAQDSGRFDIIIRYTPPPALEFLNADAQRKSGGIEVNWQTAADAEGSYVIEHSADMETFTEVQKVNARGDSLNAYVWMDHRSLDGIQFYRIKSSNMVGAVRFSRIIRVNGSADARAWSVYPNPVKGKKLTIQLDQVPAGRYAISAYDVTGRRVMSDWIDHRGGTAAYPLELAAIPSKGTGFLRIEQGGTLLSVIKIISE
jgi:hypothetical protein